MADSIVDLNDLNNCSLEKLEDYKQKIEKAFKEKQHQDKQQALEDIKSLVEKRGITPQELAQKL